MNKVYIKPAVVVKSVYIPHLLAGSDHGATIMESREQRDDRFGEDTDEKWEWE